MGDFHKFATLFRDRAATLTLCMPVVTSAGGRQSAGPPLQFPDGVTLAATFPYTRLAEYVRRFPRAFVRNAPVFWREMRAADLVWIRLPAGNGPLAFLIARLSRKPVVLFLVGYPAASRFSGTVADRSLGHIMIRAAAKLEWATIRFMARSSLVFAYGSDLAHRVQSSDGPGVHVSFTSLLSSIPPRVAHGPGNGRPRLLFLGRFAAEKGIDTLLDAAGLLAKQGRPVDIDLVGAGPLENHLRSHPAIAEGVRVTFHGWAEEGPEMEGFFRSADVFVHPSRSEGIPKTLLTAMGYGVPIVATQVGGIPDIVENGECGLLVPPDDPPRLAEAILRLLADPVLSSRLSAAAYAFASAHTADRQMNAIWREVERAFPHSMAGARG